MTRNTSPTRVDWLARAPGGVLDLRLPGDPLEVPTAVWLDRTREYYAQRRASWPQAPARAPAAPQPAPKPARRPTGRSEPPPRHPDDPWFDRSDLFA